jgi:hypothetical protein
VIGYDVSPFVSGKLLLTLCHAAGLRKRRYGEQNTSPVIRIVALETLLWCDFDAHWQWYLYASELPKALRHISQEKKLWLKEHSRLLQEPDDKKVGQSVDIVTSRFTRGPTG